MRGEHLVHLRVTEGVFSPDWAHGAVVAAYDHELFGPETLIVRTLTLNSLLYARYAIAAARSYPAEDRRHK